jgi:hypothetical protein
MLYGSKKSEDQSNSMQDREPPLNGMNIKECVAKKKEKKKLSAYSSYQSVH